MTDTKPIVPSDTIPLNTQAYQQMYELGRITYLYEAQRHTIVAALKQTLAAIEAATREQQAKMEPKP